MDFEDFNFDSILGEFIEGGTSADSPQPEKVPEPSVKTTEPSAKTPKPSMQKPEPMEDVRPVRRSSAGKSRPEYAADPDSVPVRKRAPSDGRKTGEASDPVEKKQRAKPMTGEKRAEPSDRPAVKRAAPKKSGSAGSPETPKAAAGNKKAMREAEREAREAERKAERRRKVMEKKADQRLIEESRRAAERERETVREYTERERSEKKRRDVDGRRRSRIGGIVAFLIAAILAAGIYFAAGAVESGNKSMPNLFVGNIPVGNMTREDIVRTLNDNGWSARAATPLTVSTYGGISFSVDPVQAGAVLPLEQAVDRACSYGRDGNRFSMLYKYVESLLKPVDLNDAETAISENYIRGCMESGQQALSELVGTEPYTVDMENGELRAVKGAGSLELEPTGLYNEIVAALKTGANAVNYTVITKEPVMPDFSAIHSDIYAEVVDAKYTDDGRYDVIDDVVGCDFDVSEAVNIWYATGNTETAVIPLKVTRPNVTGDELRGRLYNDLLGTMTTLYTLSSDDRINNVNLAASKINGMILYPGDLFSYNGTVGERTEEAGFRYAAAYSDGEVVQELGGGACQVSSTLYCATLYARMETVERTCHQFEVAYMDQLGLDATVSWPEPDFKFRNNKTYPVKLVAYCDNDARSITFEIWGTAEDDYTVELKTDKYQHHNADGNWVGWRTVTTRILRDPEGNIVKVPDEYGNMVDYEYTYTNEEGKPLMDTYLFH